MLLDESLQAVNAIYFVIFSVIYSMYDEYNLLCPTLLDWTVK